MLGGSGRHGGACLLLLPPKFPRLSSSPGVQSLDLVVESVHNSGLADVTDWGEFAGYEVYSNYSQS